jgi:hypothetical protein
VTAEFTRSMQAGTGRGHEPLRVIRPLVDVTGQARFQHYRFPGKVPVKLAGIISRPTGSTVWRLRGIRNGPHDAVRRIDKFPAGYSAAGSPLWKTGGAAMPASMIHDWEQVMTSRERPFGGGPGETGRRFAVGSLLSRLLSGGILRRRHEADNAMGKSRFEQAVGRAGTRLFGGGRGPRPQTLLITSSVSGEGTTTVATCLAKSIAVAHGARILLVKANPRCPEVEPFSLTEFAPKPDGEVTSPQTPQESQVRDLERRMNALDPVLPYRGDGLKALLEEAEQRYHLIVFDGPPILECPETAMLASQMDGTILVVEANRTARGAAEQAKDDIIRAGGAIIGVLLNREKQFIPAWIERLLFLRD